MNQNLKKVHSIFKIGRFEKSRIFFFMIFTCFDLVEMSKKIFQVFIQSIDRLFFSMKKIGIKQNNMLLCKINQSDLSNVLVTSIVGDQIIRVQHFLKVNCSNFQKPESLFKKSIKKDLFFSSYFTKKIDFLVDQLDVSSGGGGGVTPNS